jgi:hypothetical protein
MCKVVELQGLVVMAMDGLLGVDRMRLWRIRVQPIKMLVLNTFKCSMQEPGEVTVRLAGIMHRSILTKYINNADAITTGSLLLRGRREFICMMQVPFHISISKGTNLLSKIFVAVVLPIMVCPMVYALLQATLHIRLLVVNIVF